MRLEASKTDSPAELAVDLAPAFEPSVRPAVRPHDGADEVFTYPKREAAAKLGFSERMLEKEMRAGRILPYRVGDRPFFTPAELHRYVAARMAEAEARRAAKAA